MLYDINTGSARVVVDVTATGADIDPVVGAGMETPVVVYTELDHPISDASSSARWKLMAYIVATRQQRIIAQSSGAVPGLAAPYPRASGDWVVWTEFDPVSQDWSIRTLDLRSWTTRTLLRHVTSSSVSVDGGDVYYDYRAASGAIDVYSIAADGSGAPNQVTRSGDIALPVAGAGLVGWQEPAQGDPQSEWIADERRPEVPLQLATDGGGNVVPGRGFALWYSLGADALMLRSVNGGTLGPPIEIAAGTLDLGPRWSASDTEIAWATQDGSMTSVHVAQVSA